MRIEVRGSGDLRSDSVERFAWKAFGRSLGRFGRKVRDVFIRVRDVNGPKGGPDMEASAEIVMEHRGTYVVRAHGEDAYGAVRAAAAKAERAVERGVEKKRSH